LSIEPTRKHGKLECLDICTHHEGVCAHTYKQIEREGERYLTAVAKLSEREREGGRILAVA
jgi:hypothetical protein